MKIKYLIEALRDMDPEAEAAYRVYDRHDIIEMAEWGPDSEARGGLTEEEINEVIDDLDERMGVVGDLAWDCIQDAYEKRERKDG